jgi:pimeloyl-ACP methyl ester carboxylesterase
MRTLFRCLLTCLLVFAGPAFAQDTKIGILMLHGKNPGGPQDPYFGVLKTRFEREGFLPLMPDMPWSRDRYIDGDWDQAMAEMDQHVKTLHERGATRIVVAGHSMGCPAAMGYAARGGKVEGLVLLAPGHVPFYYFTGTRSLSVRESIERARSLLAAGDNQKSAFFDSNQGRLLSVSMTPKAYLSYFDPTADAEMSVTAPKVPASVPVLWVIGKSDPLFAAGRRYVFDKLAPNPKHLYLEVGADHLSTPNVAADDVVKWIRALVATKQP